VAGATFLRKDRQIRWFQLKLHSRKMEYVAYDFWIPQKIFVFSDIPSLPCQRLHSEIFSTKGLLVPWVLKYLAPAAGNLIFSG
jgi:hypothetical protein